MIPEPTERHPSANIATCMNELAGLFPGFAESSDAEVREWKVEFAGRPADLCLAALKRYHRADKSIYPRLATYLTHLGDEVKSRTPGLTPADRTARMREHYGQERAKAIESRRELFAWVQRLEGPERERWHELAIQRMCGDDKKRMAEWRSTDPEQSVVIASAMLAMAREVEAVAWLDGLTPRQQLDLQAAVAAVVTALSPATVDAGAKYLRESPATSPELARAMRAAHDALRLRWVVEAGTEETPCRAANSAASSG